MECVAVGYMAMNVHDGFSSGCGEPLGPPRQRRNAMVSHGGECFGLADDTGVPGYQLLQNTPPQELLLMQAREAGNQSLSIAPTFGHSAAAMAPPSPVDAAPTQHSAAAQGLFYHHQQQQQAFQSQQYGCPGPACRSGGSSDYEMDVSDLDLGMGGLHIGGAVHEQQQQQQHTFQNARATSAFGSTFGSQQTHGFPFPEHGYGLHHSSAAAPEAHAHAETAAPRPVARTFSSDSDALSVGSDSCCSHDMDAGPMEARARRSSRRDSRRGGLTLLEQPPIMEHFQHLARE